MLKKNVFRALGRKWMQFGAIGIIIVLSSFTYSMMFYGISGIEEPTETFLEEYNQEDFSVEILNTLTAQEAQEHKSAINTGELQSLSTIKEANGEIFKQLVDNRIETFEESFPKTAVELREFKVVPLDVNGDIHTALIAKDPDRINRSFIEQGRKPSNENELAINKIYAEKNNLRIGSPFPFEGREFTISGFVLFPDYTLPVFDDGINFDAEKKPLILLSDAAYEQINAQESFRFAGTTLNGSEINTAFDKEELPFVTQIVATENTMRSGAIYGELNEGKTISLGLSIFIAAIAVIMVSIMIFNLLHAERSQIGILKALGYSSAKIALPYFFAVSGFALAMLTIGYFLGMWAAEPLMALYLDFYLLPSTGIEQSWVVFATSILVPLLFFSIVFGLIIYRILKEPVLSLLNPQIHQSINGLSRIVSKLLLNAPATVKFKYLQAIRSTSSFLLFFIGIMFSTLLIFFALMLNDAIETMTSGYLTEVDYAYEAYLDLAQPIPPLQDGEEKFIHYPYAAFQDEIVALRGLAPDNQLYKLTNDTGANITTQLENGAVVSKSLQIKQQLELGDTLKVEINNEEIEFLVQGIVEEYNSDTIYVDRETLSLVLTNDRTADFYNGIYASTLPASDHYQAIFSKSGIIDQSKSIQNYSRLIFNVMITGSAVIASSILFVLTSFTVEKNYYAISLLKVMGYSRREVNAMILNSYFVYALLSFVISIPIALFLISRLLLIFAQEYGIVIPLKFEPIYGLVGLVFIISVYVASTYFSRRKIERISLQEILKTYGQ